MSNTTETHEGGCLCGAVRYSLSGAPLFSANCHCRSCQRAIGARFVTWTAVEKGALRVTRGEIKYCETSPGMFRGFCGRCGSSLEGHGNGWEENLPDGPCFETGERCALKTCSGPAVRLVATSGTACACCCLDSEGTLYAMNKQTATVSAPKPKCASSVPLFRP